MICAKKGADDNEKIRLLSLLSGYVQLLGPGLKFVSRNFYSNIVFISLVIYPCYLHLISLIIVLIHVHFLLSLIVLGN